MHAGHRARSQDARAPSRATRTWRAAAGLLLALAALVAMPAQAQTITLPDAPTGLTATGGISETRIDLAWDAPGGITLGYRIEGSTDGGTSWAELEANTDSADTRYAHTGLTPGATWHYRVAAINSAGTGARSNVASATATDVTPPALSEGSSLTQLTRAGRTMILSFDGAVDVRAGHLPPASAFTVAADGSSVPVDGVEAYGSAVPATALLVKLSSTIPGLQTVTVSYRDPTPGDDAMAIQDAAGNDAASFTDQPIPNSSWVVPAPANLTATTISRTRIDLAWDAPGGFPPAGYRIEGSTDGGASWTELVADTGSDGTAYAHTGLTPGATWHYRVAAIYLGRTALPSNVAAASAADIIPPAFSGNTGNTGVASDGAELSLQFDQSLDAGAGHLAPAGAFTVTADGSSVAVAGVVVVGTVVRLELSTVITEEQTVAISYADPTPGDDPMAVQDAAGNDAASFNSSSIPNNSLVLPAPANLTATAIGETRIDLAWEWHAPGAVTVAGYRIDVSADGGTSWSVLEADTGSTATSYSDTGLPAGATRRYRVAAINGTQPALVSNVAAATAADRTPPAWSESLTSAVTDSGVELTLVFDEILDAGAGHTPSASAFTVTADGSPVTVGGVDVMSDVVRLGLSPVITAGQAVTVSYADPTDGDDQAAVQDRAGNDAASFTAQPVGNASLVLGAPTNLTATATGATQIDLSWEAPGGFTPAGYRIEVSADGATTWAVLEAATGSTATAYSDTGVTAGATRHYRVAAIKGIQPALVSNVAGATAADSDATAPAFYQHSPASAVSASGLALVLQFGEQLDAGADHTPAASAFTVTADGIPATVAGVEITSGVVRLTLSPVITTGQAVTVSYAAPADGADQAAIQDRAGNRAAAFTARPIRNGSRVFAAPTNLTATAISATRIDLAWQGPVTTGGAHLAGYRIETSSDGGTSWTVLVAATPAISYSHGGLMHGATRHYRVAALNVTAGVTTAGLTSNVAGAGVADTVAPRFVGRPLAATVGASGDSLKLDFDERLDNRVDHTPPVSAFTVTADGAPVMVEWVSVAAKLVRLRGLSPVIATGQTVTVSYADPTDGDDQAAIQDRAGNDAASMTGQPISNLSALAAAPANLRATAASWVRIDLSWDAPSGGSVYGYRIEVSADGGTSWTVLVAATPASSYSHRGLMLGDLRHYRVAALDGNGAAGAFSNVADATAAGNADTTAPRLTAASVPSTSDRVSLEFDEILDGNPGHAPPAGAFTVTAGGSSVTVGGTEVQGQVLRLTDLSATLAKDQTVTVSYRDPTEGDDRAAVQDYAGNDAASFTDLPIANNDSPLLVGPTNLTATRNSRGQVGLSWDAPSGFTPDGYRIELAITYSEIWTDVVANTFSTDTVHSYNHLFDVNAVWRFRVRAISSTVQSLPSNVATAGAQDTVPPVFVSAQTNNIGTVVNVYFSEQLGGSVGSGVAPRSAFTLAADGIPITGGVTTTGQNNVRLTGFDPAIRYGQDVTLSYRDPTPGDDQAAAQDEFGNDAASFTDRKVDNISLTLPAPANLTAAALNETRIDLSWEAVAYTSGLVPGASFAGYQIEVSEDGGTSWSTLVPNTGTRDTAYSDTGLTHGDTRHYRVSAINLFIAGLISDVAGATTPLAVDLAPGGTPTDPARVNSPFTLTVTFSGAVTGFTASDIVVEDRAAATVPAAVADFAGSGATYTAAVTVPADGDGDYAVRVAAGAAAAASSGAPNLEVTAHYRVEDRPGAPADLTATADSATRIDLVWSKPMEVGGADITGYRIEVSADGGTSWSDLVADTESTATSHADTGLTGSSTRHYRVSAINLAVAGAVSPVASATTPPGVDLAPGGTATDPAQLTSPFTLTVTFSEAVTGFKASDILVEDRASETVPGAVSDFAGSGATYTVTVTVPAAGDYTVQVPAGAATAVSGASAAVTAHYRVVRRPGAPADLTAMAVSASRIDLEWSAPADTGGGAITGYRIEVSADGGTSWSDLVGDTRSTATGYSDTGLTSGTRHYRVSAINLAGAGEAATAAATTLLTVDLAPGGTATDPAQLTGPFTFTVTFSEAVTGFTASELVVEDGASETVPGAVSGFAGSGASYTVNVTVPAAGDYAVQVPAGAVTAVSDGAPNVAATAHYQVVVRPGAPVDLTATVVSPSRVDLAWRAPAETGGAAITGYRIEVSADGGASWNDLVAATGATATSYADTGLSSGTRHYRVSAINRAGAGAAAAAAATTPLIVDLAPGGAATEPARVNRRFTLTVTFSEAVTGFTASELVVEDGASETVPGAVSGFAGSGASYTATVTVPAAGGHTVRVPAGAAAAVSGGAASAPATAHYQVVDAPGAPAGLTATAVSASRIDLAWRAPAETGAGAVTGYRIEVSADGGTSWSDLVADTLSTATSYSHTGLMLGDGRHFRVAAINAFGVGLVSDVAAAFAADATDTTAPLFTAALVPISGDLVLVGFDEVLHAGAGHTPPASAFTVTAGGSSVTVGGTEVQGQVLRLTDLNATLAKDQTVTVSYRDPTEGDDRAAVQDYAGNDAASLTHRPVTNSSTALAVPTNLTATVVGLSKIDLAWDPPPDAGVTGYRIEESADGGTSWSVQVADTLSTVTSYSLTGLMLGATRHFRVAAIYPSGTSAASNVAGVTVVLAADRTPPVFESAITNQDGTEVNLRFSEEPQVGAGNEATASDFTLTIDGVLAVAVGVARTLSTGVQPGVQLTELSAVIVHGQTVTVSYRDPTEGDDQAAVQDVAGNDAASFTDRPVTNASAVLAAPANLTAAGISERRIDLSWEKPSDAIYGYRIEVSADGGATWSDLEADTGSSRTSYSHTVPEPGSTRHYRVSAINVLSRPGLVSEVAGATAVDTTAPVFTSAFTNRGGSEVTLVFSEPLRRGSGDPFSGSAFTVTADGVPITVGAALLEGLNVTLGALGAVIKRGQAVTVSYRDPTPGDDASAVQDVAGNDAASFSDQPVGNQSTVAPSAPGAPANLTAWPVGATRIDLDWSAPAQHGGAVISGYRIEVSADGGATWTDLVADTRSTATSHSHADLPDGDRRHYRVAAINIVGVGTASNVASASTAATIERVEITSDPGTDDRYAIGDVIEATVTFSAAVTVSGAPYLELDFGGQEARRADYAAGASTATALAFTYPVAAGDAAADGIAIGANRLQRDGGTIGNESGMDAILTHAGVAADPAHKVDGVRPTLTWAATATDGATIVLTFSERLAAATAGAAAFTVSVDGIAGTVNRVSVNGSELTLALAAAVTASDTVTVSYTDPTPGDDQAAVQDRAGNDAAGFIEQTVVNYVRPWVTAIERAVYFRGGPDGFSEVFTDEFELTQREFRLAVGFNQVVTGFEAGDLVVVNGTITQV